MNLNQTLLLISILTILFYSCKKDDNPEPQESLGHVQLQINGQEKMLGEPFDLSIIGESGDIIKTISNLSSPPEYYGLNDGFYQLSISSKKTEINIPGDNVFRGVSKIFEINRPDTLSVNIDLIFEEPFGQVTLELKGYDVQNETIDLVIRDLDGAEIKSLLGIQEMPKYIQLEDGSYKISVESELKDDTMVGDIVFSGYSTEFGIGHNDTLAIDVNVDLKSPEGWLKVPNVPLQERHAPSSFIIDNNIYVGLGKDLGNENFQDWWVYSINDNSWRQLQDFPGGKRYGSLSFSIGKKGYICLGSSADNNDLLEFWEFDSENGLWTKLDDFPGSARTSPTSFVVGNKAYIGSGIANGITSLNDFYEYDQTDNTWSNIPDFTGEATYGFTSFTINDSAHLMAGVINNDERTNRHVVFDSKVRIWSVLPPFPGLERLEGVGFSIGNKGYFGLGSITNINPSVDFWVYDPNKGGWKENEVFIGNPRFSYTHGSNAKVGYFGFGQKGNDDYNDLYLYYPAGE